MKEIYLNNNSTTKVDPEVLKAMQPYFCEYYGNPSNLHSFGRDAKEALEQAREGVASLLHSKPEEIYFTSGGTEANNLAIKGVLRTLVDKGNHIITSEIEHHSVLDSVQSLEKMRCVSVTYLPVDRYGLVDPEKLKKSLTKDTMLVSIMYGNNEIGTIEPVKELCEIAHNAGVYFHTDAISPIGQLRVDVKELGIDLLTVSAHKIHGPKGVGALYVKEGVKIEKIIYGGEQERGMRAGTENVAGIVGLGKASIIALEYIAQGGVEKIKLLHVYLEEMLKEKIADVLVNGHPTLRVPNTLNISFADVDGNKLIDNLNLEGIMVSTGAACSFDPHEASHVLKAIKVDKKFINSQVRFGLSKYNTKEEIDYTVDILVNLVNQLRSK